MFWCSLRQTASGTISTHTVCWVCQYSNQFPQPSKHLKLGAFNLSSRLNVSFSFEFYVNFKGQPSSDLISNRSDLMCWLIHTSSATWHGCDNKVIMFWHRFESLPDWQDSKCNNKVMHWYEEEQDKTRWNMKSAVMDHLTVVEVEGEQKNWDVCMY